MRATILLFGPILLSCVGCLRDNRPLGTVAQEPLHMNAAPATEATARRVNEVGNQLVRSNDLHKRGLRPTFSVLGVPSVAVFHRSYNEIFITEGMVNRCKSDEDLAAVLALELGKVLSEKEAVALAPVSDRSRPLPPIDVPIGNEVGGTFGPADGTRMAELARYEKEHPRRSTPPTDPSFFAKNLLKTAGFEEADLSAVDPLLREAHDNVSLERQLKGQQVTQP